MSTSRSKNTSPLFHVRLIGNGRILLLNKIAKGAFGDVYVALGPADPSELRDTSRTDAYPLEKLTRPYAVKRTKEAWSYAAEINSHRIVSNHSHIVTLHHVIEEETRAYLIMDYHPHGDLALSLSKNPRLYQDNQLHSKNLFIQLLEAVQHCHNLQVYHRDLKPENILLADLGGRAILADFGLSTRRAQSVDFATGSPAYMSPECLGQLHCIRPYSPMANDVWSLGVIIFRVIFGTAPWSRASPTVSRTFLEFLTDPDFFLRRYPISIEFHRLLMRVFAIDPSERVTAKELVVAIKGIEVFSLRSDPRSSVETRARYLRRLDKRMVKERIRAFGNVLDSESFLKKLGLTSSPPSSTSSLSSNSSSSSPRKPIIEVLNEDEEETFNPQSLPSSPQGSIDLMHQRPRRQQSIGPGGAAHRAAFHVRQPSPIPPICAPETSWMEADSSIGSEFSSSSTSTSSVCSSDSFILETPEVQTLELLEEQDVDIVDDFPTPTFREPGLDGHTRQYAVDWGRALQNLPSKVDNMCADAAPVAAAIPVLPSFHRAPAELETSSPALLDFMGGQFGKSGGAFCSRPRHTPKLFTEAGSVFGLGSSTSQRERVAARPAVGWK